MEVLRNTALASRHNLRPFCSFLSNYVTETTPDCFRATRSPKKRLQTMGIDIATAPPPLKPS